MNFRLGTKYDDKIRDMLHQEIILDLKDRAEEYFPEVKKRIELILANSFNKVRESLIKSSDYKFSYYLKDAYYLNHDEIDKKDSAVVLSEVFREILGITIRFQKTGKEDIKHTLGPFLRFYKNDKAYIRNFYWSDSSFFTQDALIFDSTKLKTAKKEISKALTNSLKEDCETSLTIEGEESVQRIIPYSLFRSHVSSDIDKIVKLSEGKNPIFADDSLTSETIDMMIHVMYGGDLTEKEKIDVLLRCRQQSDKLMMTNLVSFFDLYIDSWVHQHAICKENFETYLEIARVQEKIDLSGQVFSLALRETCVLEKIDADPELHKIMVEWMQAELRDK